MVRGLGRRDHHGPEPRQPRRHRPGPGCHRRGRRPSRGGGAGRPACHAAHAGPRPGRRPHRGRPATRRRPRGHRSTAGRGEWQAHPPDARRGRCLGAHPARFRGGGQAPLRSTGAHGCRARGGASRGHGHPATHRRGGRHRALQLPARAVCPQGGRGAWRRQRRHRQATQRLPADAPATGGDPPGFRPADLSPPDADRQRSAPRAAAGRQRRCPDGHTYGQRGDGRPAGQDRRRAHETLPR